MSIARGHDVSLNILRDGAALTTLRAPTDVSVDLGLDVETVDHVSETTPRVYGINGPVVVTLTYEPDSPELAQLAAAQRAKNLPNSDPGRVDFRIDMSFSIDHGATGRQRFFCSDGVYSGASFSAQGRTGRVSSSPTLTFRDVETL